MTKVFQLVCLNLLETRGCFYKVIVHSIILQFVSKKKTGITIYSSKLKSNLTLFRIVALRAIERMF